MPLMPHADGSLPATQMLDELQQPVQLGQAQVLVQFCWLHFSPLPVLQALQAVALPHAASVVPGWHWVPLQQPAGQETGVHVQRLFEHSWLEPHLVQGAPPLPQAPEVLPGWQAPLLSQQPFGQMVALQVTVDWHEPVLQTWFAPQTAQTPPPVPQACSLVPCTQLQLAAQHPVGHVLALHWTLVHFFVVAGHCWPAPQGTHWMPPVPQTAGLSPGMHAPL